MQEYLIQEGPCPDSRNLVGILECIVNHLIAKNCFPLLHSLDFSFSLDIFLLDLYLAQRTYYFKILRNHHPEFAQFLVGELLFERGEERRIYTSYIH